MNIIREYTDEQWAIKATPENLKSLFHDKINWRLFNYLDDALISKKDTEEYYKLCISVIFTGKARRSFTFHNIFVTSFETEDIGYYTTELSNRALIKLEKMYDTDGLCYTIQMDYGNESNKQVLDKMKKVADKYDMEVHIGDYYVTILTKVR